ncbi:MAG TPA: porin [Xanthobacteraceae bacterium]|jgi:hypothetical protein|nr:porin [Xanthobacteraceae bacterium]
MKMVKSLLLGSAAGLVAVTAGQAADLPVKAKPVEYVKVCSLYGAGFYYMPGTDMCIKVGGWARVEATWGNDNGNLTWGPFSGQENNRTTNNMVTRSRGYVTVDAREQTAYGTARAYLDVGISNSNVGTDSATNTFSSNRAFLQWAGFTAGLTQSFYDFYSAPAVAYRAGYFAIEDTGDGGWWLWAYTAQLGNGISATISAEQRRMTQIIGAGPGATAVAGAAASAVFDGATIAGGATSALGYGGMQVPDIVANLRVDQTWGSAQVMGALHQVNANYYAGAPAATAAGATSVSAGHPDDAWGWVLGAGLRLNFPMIAKGDYFQGEFNYAQGAMRYTNDTNTTNYDASMGNQQVFGILSDCVYGNTGVAAAGSSLAATGATHCNLTTSWTINASFEHYWTPQWHQSIVGNYEETSYNSQANAILCSSFGLANGAGAGAGAVAAAGCNNNWSMYGISSRLQWDVTKTFYVGVEVLYEHMDSAKTANGLTTATMGLGAPNAPQFVAGGMDTWAGTVRMHKDFLP